MGGPLPVKDLKNLTKLELLDLSRSGYNGSMPEFTHLEKLKALDLSGNDFSSSVELQELKILTNLEVLGLAWNNFDGPIPIEVFCEMKNLQELNIQCLFQPILEKKNEHSYQYLSVSTTIS